MFLKWNSESHILLLKQNRNFFGNLKWKFWQEIIEYLVIFVNLNQNIPFYAFFLENFTHKLGKTWVFFQFFPKLTTKSIETHFWQKFKNIKNAKIIKPMNILGSTDFYWFLQQQKRVYIYWFIQIFLFTNKLIFLQSSLITTARSPY